MGRSATAKLFGVNLLIYLFIYLFVFYLTTLSIAQNTCNVELQYKNYYGIGKDIEGCGLSLS